ncbi:hypothetical protein MKX03_024951, partial [Papaver bracteatum]
VISVEYVLSERVDRRDIPRRGREDTHSRSKSRRRIRLSPDYGDIRDRKATRIELLTTGDIQ